MCSRFFGRFCGMCHHGLTFKRIVVFLCMVYDARHHISFNALRFRLTCYLCFSDHMCIKLIQVLQIF